MKPPAPRAALTAQRAGANGHEAGSETIRTTAELARHVGLSRATVSRILNGHDGIKRKNIDRVMQVVERTGFVPNPYSRILRGQRSGTVAICLSSFKHHAVVQKLAEVVRLLAQLGFTSFIEALDNTDVTGVAKWAMRMRAEAVIFVGQHRDAALATPLAEFRAAGIPHIFTDPFDGAKANVITVDRALGLELAGRHLLDLGHRRIGLLGIGGTVPVEATRLAGLCRALEGHNLDPERALVTLADLPPRDSNMIFGREVARRFVASERMPTAFVALNDEVAFGAIEGFRAQSVRVPTDVSVVGFNNEDIAKVASPSITTIDAEISAAAGAAVNFLVGQIHKRVVTTARPRLLPPRLMVRESTGAARR